MSSVASSISLDALVIGMVEVGVTVSFIAALGKDMNSVL